MQEPNAKPPAFLERRGDGSLRAIFGTGGIAGYDRIQVGFDAETNVLTVTGVSTSAMGSFDFRAADASHAIKVPCVVKAPSEISAAVEDGRIVVTFPRDALGGSLLRPSRAPAQAERVEEVADALMEPKPRSTSLDSPTRRDPTPPPLSRQASQESLPAACNAPE